MSVLDRDALEQSPLADLHAIASELSVDGYRRLRRAALIDAILGEDGGPQPALDEPAPRDSAPDEPAPKRARARARKRPKADDPAPVEEPAPEASDPAGDPDQSDGDAPPVRRRRGRRGGASRGSAREEVEPGEDPPRRDDAPRGESAPPPEEKPRAESRRRGAKAQRVEGTGPGEDVHRPVRDQGREDPLEVSEVEGEQEAVEGVVEVLAGGAAFIRVDPPEPADGDVYVSAAQVKRCELVSGDRIAGPRRAPRRSERFASLVRVDTINGRPATEVADGVRFDDLPAAFPDERFRLGSEDPTIKAIEWLTPFGRGSRVTIVGGPRAGKTEALLRLAGALVDQPGLQLSVALAGVRPEEISEWGRGGLEPAAAVTFAASPDVQGQSVERVIDQARRVATRGGDALVLIDTLDGLPAHGARKAMAAARNLVDGGSLTVIATAGEPIGGETTVIALDSSLAGSGRFPALDLLASGTLRPELLVGEAGAEAITRARAEAIDG
ncbi:MAG: Rho termination factor N-terminal domain-containing protein [Solirubrobacteraceae bacterium]